MPTHLDALDEPTRVILGLGFLVITATAVVLGPGYPFWIAPGLVLVFMAGFGPPGNTTVAVPCSSSSGIREEAHVETITPSVVALGHLVNLSFDVSNEASRCGDRPQVIFQVYRMGVFSRITIEGYGYMDLPGSSGTAVTQVTTIRPEGNIQQKMLEFFVGGTNMLYDPSFVAPPFKSSPGAKSSLNRFGMQTRSSGTITVHTSSLFHDPSLSATEDEEDIAKTQHIRRTVDEILSEFRTSQSVSASQTLGASIDSAGGAAAADNKATLADAIRATKEATETAGRMAIERARQRRAEQKTMASSAPARSARAGASERDDGSGKEEGEPLLRGFDR